MYLAAVCVLVCAVYTKVHEPVYSAAAVAAVVVGGSSERGEAQKDKTEPLRRNFQSVSGNLEGTTEYNSSSTVVEELM